MRQVGLIQLGVIWHRTTSLTCPYRFCNFFLLCCVIDFLRKGCLGRLGHDDKADRIEDDFLRTMYRSFIKPEKYPYLLKAKSDIGYTNYFENILTMNDISMDLFHTLPPEERILFRQEMVVAIMQVIAKHFTHDSLGNSTSETLAYYESYIGDCDPFSYFAELEGIGSTEPDLDTDFYDEESAQDFEKRMESKYRKENDDH